MMNGWKNDIDIVLNLCGFLCLILLVLTFFVLEKFYTKVPAHAKAQENDSQDDFWEHADATSLGYKSKKEAHGLPKSVVREGSFLIRCKENSIESIDLSLPDGISSAPKRSQDVNN